MQPSSPITRLVFCVLLASCVLLRVHFGHGLTGIDDFAYVRAALDIHDLGLFGFLRQIGDIYANRLSLVLPLAGFQWVFGRTELAGEALGLCCSVIAIGFAFAIARRLHGEWAGWLAALLVACIPQEVALATSFTPDVALPAYVGIALYCGLRAQEHARQRQALGWHAAAAFATLCGFEARATSGLLLGVLGLHGLLQPRMRLLRAALPGLFFVAEFASLWALLTWVSGDPRLQLRQWIMDGTGTHWTGTGKPLQHLFWMLPPVRALVELPAIVQRARPLGLSDVASYVANPLLGLHYYLTWFAALIALFRLRSLPSARYPLLAFLVLYAFFEFGSTSFTSYQPIWKYERFLTLLSVPTAVLCGVVLSELRERLPGAVRTRAGGALAGVLYVGISAAAVWISERHWGNRVLSEVATMQRIKALPTPLPPTLYFTSAGWAYRAEVLLRLEPVRRAQVAVLDQTPIEVIHDALVVLDRSFFEPWSADYYDRPRQLDPRLGSRRAPAGWQLLFEVQAVALERQVARVQTFRVP